MGDPTVSSGDPPLGMGEVADSLLGAGKADDTSN
jgi:hypothetical protein